MNKGSEPIFVLATQAALYGVGVYLVGDAPWVKPLRAFLSIIPA
ncbi:hypothetical protein [Fibrella forsythiae]|nr:hypothetical protein [Fibrella forsythiae]